MTDNSSTKIVLVKLIIHHPGFDGATEELRKCYNSFGNSVNTRCISILGPSGSGKSTVIDEFARLYPDIETDSGVIRHVLVVETPTIPTLKAMASAVLKALDDPLYSRGTEIQMSDRIIVLLKAQEVRLIIFDEMQNLIDRDSLKLNSKTADWLKGLINKARVPTVIAGLEQTEQLFSGNEQLRRRFRNPFKMEPFEWADKTKSKLLRNFLKNIQDEIPFEEGLDISSSEMSYRFYCASNGLVGYIVAIIREAVDIANDCNDTVVRKKHLADAYVNIVHSNGNISVNPFSYENVKELKSALIAVAPTAVTTTDNKRSYRKKGTL